MVITSKFQKVSIMSIALVKSPSGKRSRFFAMSIEEANTSPAITRMDHLGFSPGEFETPERLALQARVNFAANAKACSVGSSSDEAEMRTPVDIRKPQVESKAIDIKVIDNKRSPEVFVEISSSNSETEQRRKLHEKKKHKKKTAIISSGDESVTSIYHKTHRKKKKKEPKREIVVDVSSGDESTQSVHHEEEDEEKDLVSLLFDQCEDISKRLSDKLHVQRVNGSSVITEEDADALFPTGLVLKDYQLVGLNWLKLLHSEKVNGILADEMGLGKTVQAVGLLSWLNKYEGIKGPHLVVAPASTLENWRREISKWLPNHRTVLYHGSQAHRLDLNRKLRSGANVDIIVTTYTYFERESCTEDRSFFSRFKFKYTIYDEAHAIKSMESSRYRRLVRIKSERRLLLSGTPVQNNLQELLALMSFCMPTVFNAESSQLQSYFSDGASATRIRSALEPFVLRRIKSDVLGSLTPKQEIVRLLEIDGLQRTLYDEILNAMRVKGRSDRKNLFSDLRKAANHPLLVRHYFGQESSSSLDGIDRSLPLVKSLLLKVQALGPHATASMVDNEVSGYSDWDFHLLASEYAHSSSRLGSMQLPAEALWNSAKCRELRKLLPELRECGHRVLIFSQWTTILDIIQELLVTIDMTFVRFDGRTGVSDRQDIVDNYNTDRSITAFLLSTRAGGMGINLTSADTVIIHDLDFNPTVDRQAEDRCHRIGQEKKVTVYKLVSCDTVDENILNISARKKELDANVLAHDEKKGPIKVIMAQLMKSFK